MAETASACLPIYRKNCGFIYRGGFYQAHITLLARKLHVSVYFKEELSEKNRCYFMYEPRIEE